jgi:hypothetical protein
MTQLTSVARSFAFRPSNYKSRYYSKSTFVPRRRFLKRGGGNRYRRRYTKSFTYSRPTLKVLPANKIQEMRNLFITSTNGNSGGSISYRLDMIEDRGIRYFSGVKVVLYSMSAREIPGYIFVDLVQTDKVLECWKSHKPDNGVITFINIRMVSLFFLVCSSWCS